jgi:hypothetical protein
MSNANLALAKYLMEHKFEMICFLSRLQVTVLKMNSAWIGCNSRHAIARHCKISTTLEWIMYIMSYKYIAPKFKWPLMRSSQPSTRPNDKVGRQSSSVRWNSTPARYYIDTENWVLLISSRYAYIQAILHIGQTFQIKTSALTSNKFVKWIVLA